MIAAISVWLGIHNVILNADDGNVILIADQICNGINIIDKRADHTNTGYIV